ncbi:MAG: type V CRISPR-associated protein Cas4 [Bacteroidetes bacterium]|nr:type V CRISPR-associated protein Cas4 [Bacteroidota bacterium]MBS1747703.1 type V CRISPR-associated protein Cas4 [Bacteroidota bacterium]
METYLPISFLNDFIFCPYSLYLHQVFDNSSEELYSAAPQQVGKRHHDAIDRQRKQEKSPNVLRGIYVLSERLGIYGKIDSYYPAEQRLVESKYAITTLYKGYYYQLWAQYFALQEMGYRVAQLAFFSIKDRKTHPIALPDAAAFAELQQHIRKIAHYDFEQEFVANPAKCLHCIYASLCDKTNTDHVYA